jgi:hypothetical protein
MADSISYFDDFQKIADILITIRNKVDSKTDIIWTGFNNPEQLINDLTSDIQKLGLCDSYALSKVYVGFGPTGIYQELSISNGWGNEYLELSKQFDYYHKRIRFVFPAV